MIKLFFLKRISYQENSCLSLVGNVQNDFHEQSLFTIGSVTLSFRQRIQIPLDSNPWHQSRFKMMFCFSLKRFPAICYENLNALWFYLWHDVMCGNGERCSTYCFARQASCFPHCYDVDQRSPNCGPRTPYFDIQQYTF